MGNRRPKIVGIGPRALGCLLALMLAAAFVRAQTPSADPPVGEGVEVGGGVLGAPGSGEARVQVIQFGYGGVARPADWVGLQLLVTDLSAKPRDVVVRVALADVDGDRALYQREIATTPGADQRVWMYVRLPRWIGPQSRLVVSVSEALPEGGSPGEPGVAGEGRSGFVAGRVLGRAEIVPAKLVGAQRGLIGVMGTNPMGLLPYGRATQGGWSPLGHESAEIVGGLRPADLPDRWMGLGAYELIVWGEGDPGLVRGERARALREWIERGGHLVVVLPSAGQAWTGASAGEIADLLPSVTITRKEGVPQAGYRSILNALGPDIAMGGRMVVHSFEPRDNAGPTDAMPIVQGPGGETVVSRKLVGTGMVTLVGLNLPALQTQSLIQPEVFWNRVLGKRGRYADERQIAEMQLSGDITSRQEIAVDGDIAGLISKSGRSAAGVLLGFFVFIAYWLVAGPAGYWLLKHRGWHRHAWLAYVGVGLVFTGIAWGGATALRPAKAEATHLTILDHVYGQPVQRARSWMSVLIPSYGNVEVGIAGEESGAGAGGVSGGPVNAVVPWEGLEADGPGVGFPDARGYVVASRAPGAMEVPARSTVKQVQVDWLGGPVWRMPAPVPGADGAPSRLTLNENRRVSGVLTHDLPGTLEDVFVIVVPGQRPVTATPGRMIIADASMFLVREWKPGQTLDLDAATAPPPGQDASLRTALRTRLDGMRSSAALIGPAPLDPARAWERLALLAMFQHFEPPDFLSERGTLGVGARPALATRSVTHGWDLSEWLSQPCLIVIGHLRRDANGQPAAGPVGVTLNGTAVPQAGWTVVRWVYPLAAQPVRADESVVPQMELIGQERRRAGSRPDGEGADGSGGDGGGGGE